MSGNLTGHALLGRVEELLGRDLRAADEIFDSELESWHPYVTDVVAHVTRYRGKRLRPILLLLAARATGSISDAHHTLAAVVEMIHAATLVHDDVLDDADTRRHVATVNSRWNTETSVLCGDYLFTHAFHLAASLPDTLACRMIGRATNLVCEGELAQVHERANCGLTEDEYLRIIDGKTAELCALSCFLGAHFAGAQTDVSHSLQQFGRCLGMAFQIADDLLDIVGKEDSTGKSLGSDLDQQKLTMPVIRLLATSDDVTNGRVRELLASPITNDRRELLEYLERSDALDYAQSRADQYVSQARMSLRAVDESPARVLLEEIAEFACRRSF